MQLSRNDFSDFCHSFGRSSYSDPVTLDIKKRIDYHWSRRCMPNHVFVTKKLRVTTVASSSTRSTFEKFTQPLRKSRFSLWRNKVACLHIIVQKKSHLRRGVPKLIKQSTDNPTKYYTLDIFKMIQAIDLFKMPTTAL